VWGIVLEADPDLLLVLSRCLSAEEKDRAERLVSPRHRTQRLVAYGALRMILSRYGSDEPHALVIERTSAGKPVLRRGATGGRPLRFNLTHSQGRALIAVTASRDVGVDLEKIEITRDVVGLAKRFLCVAEQAAIERFDGIARQETFLRLWVAREAVFKAIGTGLTLPLDRSPVEVSGDGKVARLVGEVPDGADSDYAIRFVPVEPGWIAAVAARGHDWHFSACRFDEA
jgi:4'-phosphopantetheinyl transferase